MRGHIRQQFERIGRMDADVLEAPIFDDMQELRDAVDEGLAADEADIGMRGCERRQMFSAPESNFEKDFGNFTRKKRARIAGCNFEID